ncbi:MAG TPA: PhoPQ-activated protein PqaA family protein, partial [Fimbriimonadaceae bacterium]|nr:PhoPQ-activated protein PqaA family protein [Fimbriimonadaceae bacterium]
MSRHCKSTMVTNPKRLEVRELKMIPQSRLFDYVSKRDGYSWRRDEQSGIFSLTSGPWQGSEWNHQVVIVRPNGSDAAHGMAVLYITGGEPNPLDIEEAQTIADRANLPVAMLFHIPNQPIFDLWEDDLIAHTFERFIDTGDLTWPLLYPMTRAAIRAMDMLEEAAGIAKFVVTGASKRGWTTWLTAATGDARVIGIAPMVIDNLNFPAQMAHQIECWGGYSEQIEDYTRRELQNEMDSIRGGELVAMMDPIH